jgi:hypothetical protein
LPARDLVTQEKDQDRRSRTIAPTTVGTNAATGRIATRCLATDGHGTGRLAGARHRQLEALPEQQDDDVEMQPSQAPATLQLETDADLTEILEVRILGSIENLEIEPASPAQNRERELEPFP